MTGEEGGSVVGRLAICLGRRISASELKSQQSSTNFYYVNFDDKMHCFRVSNLEGGGVAAKKGDKDCVPQNSGILAHL